MDLKRVPVRSGVICMEINRREIRRYLGYGRQEADEKVSKLIEECVEELEAAASPKSIYRVYPFAGGRAGFYGVSDEEPESQP